jgi:hypothetical protein
MRLRQYYLISLGDDEQFCVVEILLACFSQGQLAESANS